MIIIFHRPISYQLEHFVSPIMKFPLVSIIAFLTVMLGAMHAALSPEIYWKSMLPNTPMPEFLQDLLHPTVNAGNITGVTINRSVRDWNDAMLGTCHNCIKPNYYQYNNECCPPANMNNLLHNSNETMYFLEKDLNAGRKMNLHFTHTIKNASFLPRQVVKSIPFSSSKMDEILNNFNVERGSVVAKVMKSTINICELPGIKGEERYCATTLESMVDFITSELGTSVKTLSLEATNQTKEEEYKIMHGVKKVGDTQVMVCHKLNYVYAVFLCHKIDNTVAYTVPLEGEDGSRIKALCVCHRDTSNMSPKHLSFQLLKVKPGTVPICHFLSQDTIMWVAKQN